MKQWYWHFNESMAKGLDSRFSCQALLFLQNLVPRFIWHNEYGKRWIPCVKIKRKEDANGEKSAN